MYALKMCAQATWFKIESNTVTVRNVVSRDGTVNYKRPRFYGPQLVHMQLTKNENHRSRVIC